MIVELVSATAGINNIFRKMTKKFDYKRGQRSEDAGTKVAVKAAKATTNNESFMAEFPALGPKTTRTRATTTATHTPAPAPVQSIPS